MSDKKTRVVSFPIREILDSELSVLDTFKPAWRLSTDLANWCQRALVTHDPGLRLPGQEKIAPYDPRCVHLRGIAAHATASYPGRDQFKGCAGSISAITRAVEQKWKEQRFDVLWHGKASACVYRFAFPWEMRAQELKILMRNESPCASLTLPGGRVTVRLAGGPEFRRQLAQFRVLLAEPERICGSKVTARFEQGNLRGAMLRLVGKFDKGKPTGDNVCFLHTDPNALLVAEINDRQVWIANADHLKRWHAAHRVYLQRSSEDIKRENRMDRSQRNNFRDSRATRCQEQNDRIDTGIKQIAAQVLRLCQRQDVGILAYDDTIRSYFPDGFSWHILQDAIRKNVEGHGIEMCDRQPHQEKQEWLASTKNLRTASLRAIAHKSRPRSKSHPKVSTIPATSTCSTARS